MEIRMATVRDLPAINRIYNQAVADGYATAHLYPLSPEARQKWFTDHDPRYFPVFVLEDGNEIMGWISLGAYRKDRQALAHVAEVSYYVDREERGKGLGSALLAHAIGEAPAFGFSVLIAILLDRNPASIALLEKYGFALWGRMPGIARMNDQEADHLYYGLKL
jgi:L-amino acid N-acyltransferase YncA